MHVVRRHDRHVRAHGHLGQYVVACDVVGRPVVPDLDRDVLAPEALDQLPQASPGGARSLGHERAREGTLTTSREHQPLVRGGRDVIEREARRPLLPSRQVRERESPRESGVARGRTRE